MQKPRLQTLKYALGILAATAALAARAGGSAFGDATLPEQIIQETTLLDQLDRQITTAESQLKQLADGFGADGLQPWQTDQIKAALTNLVNIIAQAQGVSYTAQDVAQKVTETYGDPGQRISNYSRKVADWTANTNSQIAAALKQYQLNAQDMQTQQDALRIIEVKTQSASGTKDLLQASNQIGGLMVTQIQKLQSDMQAGNQLIANRMGQQANQDTHKNDALKSWLDNDAAQADAIKNLASPAH